MSLTFAVGLSAGGPGGVVLDKDDNAIGWRASIKLCAMQFPSSGTQCTSSITAADPALGPLQDNGGPTKTMLPAAGGPAIGRGTGCPQIDQRGNPRPSACTLGAVEAT